MPPTNDAETLQAAGLQDTFIQEQLQDILARSSSVCDAEYGHRADDGHIVFHFFPPGYAADDSVTWPKWEDFRDRLERAIMRSFDRGRIEAGYVEELKSFFLIVRYRPQVPDLTALIERFFDVLEAGSETETGTTR
jgi:hypothetical protein